ncbi:uncharacterized protein I303_100620 [Kwoniella dejecticola CBS 10117]|uniref:Uncharacterized protein n=1 Tax=Kwoniella dejecticola CBS 10117 TaxID=1296121 RepID=A0A1A6AFH2_9TREE|nr:uncharacterized protein I303_00623 [Kwoniella dejecticola CBS 10117]OBR88806.1 hypothetical protein I303_00623 [Kwoniella dejecticola CBS 10117]
MAASFSTHATQSLESNYDKLYQMLIGPYELRDELQIQSLLQLPTLQDSHDQNDFLEGYTVLLVPGKPYKGQYVQIRKNRIWPIRNAAAPYLSTQVELSKLELHFAQRSAVWRSGAALYLKSYVIDVGGEVENARGGRYIGGKRDLERTHVVLLPGAKRKYVAGLEGGGATLFTSPEQYIDYLNRESQVRAEESVTSDTSESD